MAKAPGLDFKEKDQSTVVGGSSPKYAGCVFWSLRGRLNEVTLRTTTKKFRDHYGNEAPGFLGHYACVAALAQGPVYCLRTADADDLPRYGGLAFIWDGGSGDNEQLTVGPEDLDDYSFTGDQCMLVTGENQGAWNAELKVAVTHDDDDDEVFYITIYSLNSAGSYVQVEKEYTCSRVVTKVDGYGKSMYVEDVINDVSAYIRVKDNTDISELLRPSEQETEAQLTGGDNGTAPSSTDIANAWDTYWKNKNAAPAKILMAGGQSDAVVVNKLNEICGLRGDCVAINDTANVTAVATLIASRDLLSLTYPSYSAMYTPYVKARDANTGKLMELPPSGYVAAAIMRKNREGQIQNSVFGRDFGILPVLGCTVDFDAPEVELLAQAEINAIVTQPGIGTLIWGGRTLQPSDSALSWLNVRELLNDDEERAVTFLLGWVGRDNTPYERFRVQSGLEGQFKPRVGSAYYNVDIVCNDDNNTSETIDAGDLVVDIYVQPVKSINRIKFTVTVNRTGQVTTSESIVAA